MTGGKFASFFLYQKTEISHSHMRYHGNYVPNEKPLS